MGVLLKSNRLWPADQGGAPGPKRYLHLYFGCDLDTVRLGSRIDMLHGCALLRERQPRARVSTETLCASAAKCCVLGKDCFRTEQSVHDWCPCGGMVAHWSVQGGTLWRFPEGTPVLPEILGPCDVG